MKPFHPDSGLVAGVSPNTGHLKSLNEGLQFTSSRRSRARYCFRVGRLTGPVCRGPIGSDSWACWSHGARRQSSGFEVDSIAKNHTLAEREPRIRAVPVDEVGNSVPIT